MSDPVASGFLTTASARLGEKAREKDRRACGEAGERTQHRTRPEGTRRGLVGGDDGAGRDVAAKSRERKPPAARLLGQQLARDERRNRDGQQDTSGRPRTDAVCGGLRNWRGMRDGLRKPQGEESDKNRKRHGREIVRTPGRFRGEEARRRKADGRTKGEPCRNHQLEEDAEAPPDCLRASPSYHIRKDDEYGPSAQAVYKSSEQKPGDPTARERHRNASRDRGRHANDESTSISDARKAPARPCGRKRKSDEIERHEGRLCLRRESGFRTYSRKRRPDKA